MNILTSVIQWKPFNGITIVSGIIEIIFSIFLRAIWEFLQTVKKGKSLYVQIVH